MPLEKGRGQKHHGNNVSEMMSSYRKTGKIGNTSPRSIRHAERIANAVVFEKRRDAGEKV